MDTTGNHIVKNSFPVLNMTCTSCAAGVKSKVSSLNGVKSASVNFATESVQVEYDNEKISPADIKKAVQEIGYDIFLEDSKDIHKKETFSVLKMTCTSCAAGVEKTISSLEGVNFAAVNFATESVQVDYIPSKINPIDIQKAVRESGYDMIIEEDKSHKETLEEIHDKRHKALKHKTRWAIILATPVMIIGMFMMDIPYANLIMLVLSSPVVLWLGRDFFINAWKQAKNRTANMDTLVALSTGTAYIFSLFNMLFPQVWESKGLEAHVYFEAAAVIIAFILIGKLLEERAKGNTSSALKN